MLHRLSGRAPRLTWLVLAGALLLPGCGEKSSPSSTAPPPPSPPPPGSIGAFAAVPGDGSVTLHWRVSADGSVASTLIRRKAGSMPTGPEDGDLVYQGSDTTTVDRSVVNGTTYTYAAWARSSSGDLTGPVSASAQPMPATLTAPGAFTATAGPHSVSLTWVNPTTASFDHVRVMLKTGGYPSGPNDGTLVYEGSGTSASWSNLTPDQTVYVSAWAYDNLGQRSPEARASATPTWEYQDIAVAAWSQSHLYPDHPLTGAGDRDFSGNGPHVTAHLHYELVQGTIVTAVLDYRAEETGGDSTWAAKTFVWTRATVPAGWTFDSWRDDVDQTVEYTDTDQDSDRFPETGSFDPALPIDNITFVGDTKGDDVGGTSNDDTQIWKINARARTFRVRR